MAIDITAALSYATSNIDWSCIFHVQSTQGDKYIDKAPYVLFILLLN